MRFLYFLNLLFYYFIIYFVTFYFRQVCLRYVQICWSLYDPKILPYTSYIRVKSSSSVNRAKCWLTILVAIYLYKI